MGLWGCESVYGNRGGLREGTGLSGRERLRSLEKGYEIGNWVLMAKR